MRTQMVVAVLDGIVSVPLIPVVLISTFVLGILVNVTFGLLLLPISLVWIVLFFGPLMGLSWLWLKAPLLRLPLAIVGVPLAVLAGVFAGLIPSMGEMESRLAKLLLASSWPYTLQVWRWQLGKVHLDDPNGGEELLTVIHRETRGNAPMLRYVQGLHERQRPAPTPVPDTTETEDLEDDTPLGPEAIDLMAALRASVEKAKQEERRPEDF